MGKPAARSGTIAGTLTARRASALHELRHLWMTTPLSAAPQRRQVTTELAA